MDADPKMWAIPMQNVPKLGEFTNFDQNMKNLTVNKIDQLIKFEGNHCMCSKDKAKKLIRLMDGWKIGQLVS